MEADIVHSRFGAEEETFLNHLVVCVERHHIGHTDGHGFSGNPLAGLDFHLLGIVLASFRSGFHGVSLPSGQLDAGSKEPVIGSV